MSDFTQRLSRWQRERQRRRPAAAPNVEVRRKAVDDTTAILRTLTFTYLTVWA